MMELPRILRATPTCGELSMINFIFSILISRNVFGKKRKLNKTEQNSSDDLWRVIADLEETFQTLVGAKARIQPAKSKALPPVFNSTDSFLQQVQSDTAKKANNEI